MKLIATFGALSAFMASSALAGGIERTPQSVRTLFEDGRYLEFGVTFGNPRVTGSGVNAVPGATGPAPSGNITDDFYSFGASFKADLNDRLSYAIIFDQPFGADVQYPTGTGNLFAGSNATFDSNALTGVLQYNFDNGFSVYGGVRAQSIEADVALPFVSFPAGYTAVGDRELEFGYLVGVAFERPDIALRVALTYNSAIDYDLGTVEAVGGTTVSTVSTEIETPQSVNLEFQTGIAKDTLLFGSVRWVEWSEFAIDPAFFASAISTTGDALVFFEDDRVTLNLGLGRRLNDTWTILGSLGYERTTGSTTGNLGPTDGFMSASVGAIYTRDNMRITGGISYVDIGSATTNVGARFTDNSAFGATLRFGYSF
ncbi:MAG: OmpP1/FadL family transporter [Arenibacterium sp.]